MSIYINSKEAEKQFTSLLHSVRDEKTSVIIEEEGQPIAAIISFAQFDAFRKAEEERIWRLVDEIQERNANEDPEELEQFITEIVEEVRQELYDKQQAAMGGR